MAVPNPSELLGSKRGRDTFAFLAEKFGIVVIDTPPLSLTADSLIFSHYADAGIIVIGSGMSEIKPLRKVFSEQGEFTRKIVGGVLNFEELSQKDTQSVYSYYNY
jgi:Mrp family chromosome partitioning ATPase